mmetsp:Transcript_78316/g.162708  ORF Transcript_78316/g.162708 Transcript_78316/m.162708 type:complete len:728 (-) Transcript_78316:80-2263(-)
MKLPLLGAAALLCPQAVLGAKFVGSHGAVADAASSSFGISSQNPLPRVIQLITELKQHIIKDGKVEQESYDKYACWCEDTLARKAKDISDAKEKIDELQHDIKELEGEIASHQAEMTQLKKDIMENVESRREATEARDKEYASYNAEKTESEQCAGALEAAVKVLAGAGTGAGANRGFLETTREAQLLSVVAGVRSALGRRQVSSMAHKDLDAVRRFVEQPESFLGGRAAGLSAAQIENNPFGDYAPQSTQIQGILKGMYDTFVGDLEKNSAEEADSQKAFEALMATKLKEAETLQASLERETADEATKSQKLAESREVLDDTKAKLEADEAFFAQTKEGCQTKSKEWSERTRLRTEELAGVGKAIEILTTPEATKIFDSAHNTFFLQLASKTHGRSDTSDKLRDAALAKLRQAAGVSKSIALARIAVQLKNGGHFDKVIASIESMIAVLRQEEQADIQHRDRCQGAENKNKNDLEDLSTDIEKAQTNINRLHEEATTLGSEIEVVMEEIAATRTSMEERLALRNGEVAAFKQALKDDQDAVALLKEAAAAIQDFYTRNNLDFSLLSQKQEPTYSEDPDKAPETTWSGSNYSGRKHEDGGIVSILLLVAEDLENEMKVSRANDAESQKMFEQEHASMKETLNSQLALKLAKEKELSSINFQLQDFGALKDAKTADHLVETQLEKAIYQDCSWVATHFDSRRDKRKAEIDGLVDAKGYLAGVDAGDIV